MTATVAVDDPADPRLSDFRNLRDRDLRGRVGPSDDAEEGGVLIAEGALVIRQLLRSPYRLRAVLLTPRARLALEADMAAVDVPVYVAGEELLRAVSGFKFHRGALASADRGPPKTVPDVAAAADLLLVAEGVNDNENVGGLFRNGAAFGVDGVVLDPSSADPLYRRSIRVSMGHALNIPFARAEGWPAPLASLRAMGFEIVALTPAPGAEDVTTVDWQPRQVLLVGSEAHGLSEAVLQAADRRVRIGLAPGVDSLNVATAAAIALHLRRAAGAERR